MTVTASLDDGSYPRRSTRRTHQAGDISCFVLVIRNESWHPAKNIPGGDTMQHLGQSEFSRLRKQAGISIEELSRLVGFSISTLYRWERGEASPRKAVVAVLEEKGRLTRPLQPAKPAFRFIDLFAGIGGLRRGFEPLGGKCVFTSEWDRYAQATYKANYACDHEVAGDITKVGLNDIPDHDVLLAGFPCQPFSIAGVSKKNALNRPHGFADETQGTLFFDVAHIIAHHTPRAFVLENVKNLVNHDRGNTFRIIRRTLEKDLGYKIHTRVVDAKGFVPQHRERIFIVGFREDNGFTFDNFVEPDPLKGPKLRTVLHPEDGTEKPDRHYTIGSKRAVDDRYVLTDHLWRYLQDYAAKHKAAGNGFGFGLVGPGDVTRTLSARYFKDGSEILVERGRNRNPRRLTPRECSRLMGFDKEGESAFNIVVSDTQAYKQFGNAVVVPVVEAVARHMAPWICPAVESEEESVPLRRVG